jgi:hypothetical protein
MEDNGVTNEINKTPDEDGDFITDMLLDLEEAMMGKTESIPELDDEHRDLDHAITSNEELLQDR